MFKLDNDFLISLGLGSLPVDEKNRLLQVIYERLEMNVGMRLAEKMTDQQLNEFESFIDRNDEAGALHWLETNFPNYKDVVAEELEKLKKEVSASVPQILAAAQNAPAAPGQNGPMSPAPAQQGPAYQQPQPTAPMPSSMPGQQPASEPQAYNPENPFQSRNPEFGGGTASQPSSPSFGAPQTQSMPQPEFQSPVPQQPQANPQQPVYQPVPPAGPSQPAFPPVQPAPGFNPTPSNLSQDPSQQPPAGFPPQQ